MGRKKTKKKGLLADAFSDEKIKELLEKEEGDIFEKVIRLLKKGYNFLLWTALVHVQAYRNIRDKKIPWWAKLTYISLMALVLILYNLTPIDIPLDSFIGPMDNLAIYGGITVSFNKWSEKRRKKLPPPRDPPSDKEALEE